MNEWKHFGKLFIISPDASSPWSPIAACRNLLFLRSTQRDHTVSSAHSVRDSSIQWHTIQPHARLVFLEPTLKQAYLVKGTLPWTSPDCHKAVWVNFCTYDNLATLPIIYLLKSKVTLWWLSSGYSLLCNPLCVSQNLQQQCPRNWMRDLWPQRWTDRWNQPQPERLPPRRVWSLIVPVHTWISQHICNTDGIQQWLCQ